MPSAAPAARFLPPTIDIGRSGPRKEELLIEKMSKSPTNEDSLEMMQNPVG